MGMPLDTPPLEALLPLYSQMLRIRRFEEAAFQSYQKGYISGFCHLYIGQEAVAVGALSWLEEGDKVLTSYRDHGHALTLGMGANALMAELFGRRGGCCKGKGGSMHLFGRERGFLGGNGIVGSHVPVAAGVAFAQKYRQERKVTLVFFGDGAAQQGAVHEAMNLAGLWRLPLVFILENNRYGMGTAVERASAIQDLCQRAPGYNFSGVMCDGMDVLDVREKVGAAVSLARQQCTPTLVEAKTYRYRGHSMSDPALYRTAEEVERFKHQDPLLMLKAAMISGHRESGSSREVTATDRGSLARSPDRPITRSPDDLLTRLDELDQAAKAEAKQAVEFALSSPEPEPAELAEHVYAQPWAEGLLPQF